MSYVMHLLVMMAIYLPLAYSLNLPLGFGGLVAFNHAAFYGIGAFAYALLVKTAGFNPVLALALAVLFTAGAGAGIGAIALRFRGDLFLFATLGLQMIVFVILNNWVDLTNGPYGIPGIPRPEIFDTVLRTPQQYLALAALMNLLVISPLFLLYRSPFGSILKALREDETAAQSLGINSNFVFLQALTLAAAFAAIPGAFYAAYVTYIDPSSFTLSESVFQAAILLLGGAGNRKGPFLGVVVMLLLPETLRFLGLPDAVSHNLREIIYGLLLAIMMYARPQGLMGEFKPS